jgi:hypothetical protein
LPDAVKVLVFEPAAVTITVTVALVDLASKPIGDFVLVLVLVSELVEIKPLSVAVATATEEFVLLRFELYLSEEAEF